MSRNRHLLAVVTVVTGLSIVAIHTAVHARSEVPQKPRKKREQEPAASTTSGDVRARYPKLSEKPFGRGVFAHARRSGNANPAKPAEIRRWAQHPDIAGTQLAYSWEELEPSAGEYRWDVIESDMDPWAKHGKKVWIELSTANKRDVGSKGNKGSPDWVFEAGVPKVVAEGTAPYPVFWDAKYKELWGTFIRSFAAHFDGDPRIEFVSTGGYSGGSEPSLSQDDNEVLMDQWRRHGFDGFSPSGIYLNQAIKPILQFYADSFHHTPVAQVIHVKSDFDHAMNRHVASLKFIVISNGLGYAKFNAKERREWRERRETLGVKTGFAEWGPLGRSAEKIRRNKDPEGQAKLIDCYQAAIGSDSDPELRPASHISYLPLSERVPEVETEEEWDAALRWASEHLERQ
jgi:hypothetical protein